MADKVEQLEMLNENPTTQTGPVTCLGMTFENDEARRAYFTEELRKKLPELRKIEGFPIGEDEDILALSDPPYYTACPNPWIDKFLAEWGSKDISSKEYNRKSFALDVIEGKNDPLYNLPSYHTKVPPRAIMRYILHYTEPGDIILDAFAGTGMTGVAAKLCSDKKTILELGYKIDQDNNIFDINGEKISKVGSRNSILVDLSTVSSFTSAFMNRGNPLRNKNINNLEIVNFIQKEIVPLYTVIHDNEQFEFDYAVWSDWGVCEDCGTNFRLFDHLIDWDNHVMKSNFNCPNCGLVIEVKGLPRYFETKYDEWSGLVSKAVKSSQVMVSRKIGNRVERIHLQDNINNSIKNYRVNFIPRELEYSHMTHERNNLPKYWGITHIHHFYTPRNYYALDKIVSYSISNRDYIGLFSAISIIENNATKRNRFYVDKRRPNGSPIGPLSNTLYVPTIQVETNIGKKVIDTIELLADVATKWPAGNSVISNQSATDLKNIPSNSIDFIFTDPPFGKNINYSEQNILTEWWLRVYTNNKEEAIINNVQKKGVLEYQKLMTECFKEYFRVLKPNRWMVVEFHNSSNVIWNTIQLSLEKSGFVVTNVSILDKMQNTLHQDHKSTAVNKDLAITVYKPKERIIKESKDSIEDEVWEFVDNHLMQLPLYIEKGNQIAQIPERKNYILFDRMVSYYLQKGISVPLSAADFYLGLNQRYHMRDDMYFHADQASQYDRKKMSIKDLIQMEMFIVDERSAINWLKQLLYKKPMQYQEIYPLFIKESRSWSDNDKPIELLTLLEQNFLKYDGEGEVPSQIHTYLSSDYKDLRNLSKNDPRLIEKAKNRWYVPDPNKQADLEKLREKSLLREFNQYVEELSNNKKKLKQFRTEAIRVGFYKAWTEKNYQIIVDIGNRLPESILQEDEKLLRYYDNAQTKLGL